MHSTPRNVLSRTLTDARQRGQQAKTAIRKRRRRWYSAIVSATVIALALLMLRLRTKKKPLLPDPRGAGSQPSRALSTSARPFPSAVEGGLPTTRPTAERSPDIPESPSVPVTSSDVSFPTSRFGPFKYLSLNGLQLHFRRPSSITAFDPQARDNTVVVIPGNGSYAVGGSGANEEVARELRRRAQEAGRRYTSREFRLLTSLMHRRTVRDARQHPGRRLARSRHEGEPFLPFHTMYMLTPSLRRHWNREEVGLRAGTVLLDLLTPLYALGGNVNNRTLAYVVPPNGRAGSQDFYYACENTTHI